MKEFDRKDVLAITNIEDAKQYVNKEGYFNDSFVKDLKAWQIGILKEVVEEETDYPFYLLNPRGGISVGFRLFLPLDKVKEVEKEKKYRAFKDLDEFANTLGLVHILGSEITYRTKAEDTKGNAIITKECTSGHMSYISLGSHSLSLKNLFKYYEWLDRDGKWQPFGVEE